MVSLYCVLYGSSDFRTETYTTNYPRAIYYGGSTRDEVAGYENNSSLRVPLHLPQGAVLC